MKGNNCKFYQGETFGYHFCSERGRILPEMCNICPDKKAKSKYHNVKTVVDDIKFDSKKESVKWQELKMLEKAGAIKNLERQKRFLIVPKTKDERAVFYVADFTYTDCKTGQFICEDVKSKITRANSTYIIKRKLFKHLFPEYEFRET